MNDAETLTRSLDACLISSRRYFIGPEIQATGVRLAIEKIVIVLETSRLSSSLVAGSLASS
jgi:hypothetical protein